MYSFGIFRDGRFCAVAAQGMSVIYPPTEPGTRIITGVVICATAILAYAIFKFSHNYSFDLFKMASHSISLKVQR